LVIIKNDPVVLIKQIKVNANANTNGGFEFSGKGVKVSSARREAVLV